MPWYYAGPDHQPVGPISLEDLQRKRTEGVIAPETYVIEHTGVADPSRAWRPYREIFPAAPSPAFPLPPAVAFPPAPAFGSAAPPPAPRAPLSGYPETTLRPAQPPARKTNGACQWSFILGLASFPLLLCAIGPLVAIPGLILSVVGLVQVQGQREQSGRGLAIFGAIVSSLTLLIALTMGILLISMKSKSIFQTQTTTETTNSDSN